MWSSSIHIVLPFEYKILPEEAEMYQTQYEQKKLNLSIWN